MKNIFRLAIISSLCFLVAGILTINNYGISWDEPTHFKRGQAYLHYFLTGKGTYEGLPEYDVVEAKKDPNYHKRSFWQIEAFNLSYHLQNDGDHPVLNDILASLTNHIFYQKLGWVGDIQGYHLFNILISAVLVGIVFLWGAETFGTWVGIISATFTATYPLFWAESHFNIKDPAETAFFALTLYFLWKAINSKKARHILYSSIFAGAALATKFNIVFAPFIVLPWLAVLIFLQKKTFFKSFVNKRFLIAAAVFPVITVIIFVGHWPYLWQDLFTNTIGVIDYYKYIGLEDNYGSKFYIQHFNLYAPRWIFFTTPPLILLTFLIGLVKGFKDWKEKSAVIVLWLVWFSVPILRVMYPGTSIYSGSRQIMEFLPPMALIAGYGLNKAIELVSKRLNSGSRLKPLVIILSFVFLVFNLYRIHPNENVYFNSLSGGLKHQKEIGAEDVGFSFGNAYWQGVQWLNRNASDGAKIALVQGTNLNVPPFTVRDGIEFSNFFWTGIERGGEYLMEVVYNGELKTYFYAWEYVENTLDPVYEVKVDDVAILKIWKNDWEHTKPEYRKKEVDYSKQVSASVMKNKLLVTIPDEVMLSRLTVHFTKKGNCTPTDAVFVDLSSDGKTWVRERDTLASTQMSQRFNRGDNEFWYFFAGKKAKYIRVEAPDTYSCVLHNPRVSLKVLE